MKALPHRRALAVLAVLAVCGDLGCTRERLLALLWPESDEPHARHGLRDALHAIRQVLTPSSIPSTTSLLRVDPGVVGSDVLEFSRAIAAGRRAEAVESYGGPLLDGFHVDGAAEFEQWLAGERTRLARQCVEALEQLATDAEASASWAEAVKWWGRAVEQDPINSRFVLRQMRAMAATGDRANAIQAGEAHIRQLRDEFGLEVDPAVTALIARIRRGELPAVPDAGPIPAPQSGSSSPAAPVLGDRRRPTPAPSAPPAAAAPVALPRWVAWLAAAAAVVVVLASIRTAWGPPAPTGQDRPPRTAIAVLPFTDLTADTAWAWFAPGLHDELLAQLARVVELRVIGPASVEGYREGTTPLDQVADELGVGSIVQGSVQVLDNRLRVIVHLVDPATQADRWAETYDRPLDDAFAVQSDIARQIVGSVGVTLSQVESSGIASAPTASAEAYLLYLQGLDYARRPGDMREDLVAAQDLFQRAIRLDSTFALAHAALSRLHGTMRISGHDRSPDRARLQLEEARTALRLAPDLPDAHAALALASCCNGRIDRRAHEELTTAARYAPNDARLWGIISLAQAWMGNWDGADSAFERARRLDPRNTNLYQAQGDRLHCRRRYPEAIAMYRRALALAPDFLQPHISLAWSYILWQGQLDTLWAVLGGHPDVEPGSGAPRVGVEQAILFLWQRQPDSVLALLRTMPGDSWSSGAAFYARPVLSASARLLLGDTAAARAALDSAATLLDAAVRTQPDAEPVHTSRGVVMAMLGRRTEALREVRWLEQSAGYRHDQDCPQEPEGRAAILTRLGEADSAVAAIERLLAGRSRVTANTLRLDPTWDPIRGDPRFQALLVKYRNPELPAAP